MITKYNKYIKESITLPSSISYFTTDIKTFYRIKIKMNYYQYELSVTYDLDEDDLNNIELRTKNIANYDIKNNIDRYINDYIKKELKIDFKKDEVNEKLFLYFGLKFDLNVDIVMHYDNDVIIDDNYIYLSGYLTLKEVLDDLKYIYDNDEYNNIDKFIDDNIDNHNISNSIYLEPMLRYCKKETIDKYKYIFDAKKFDLI